MNSTDLNFNVNPFNPINIDIKPSAIVSLKVQTLTPINIDLKSSAIVNIQTQTFSPINIDIKPSSIVNLKVKCFSPYITGVIGNQHNPVTVTDSDTIDFTIDGNQVLTGTVKADSIGSTEIDNTILSAINSALQSGDNISELNNDVGYITSFTETDPIYTADKPNIALKSELHDAVTLGTNTANALSLDNQELSIGDVFVQNAGDTMTGDLVFANASIDNPDYIQFNTAFEDGHAEGRLQWNIEDGTLEYGLSGNTVNLQIGQEEVVKVSNGENTPILNGQVVTFVGSQGKRPKAYRCIAGDPIYGHPCGIATENITNNGYVCTHGLVRDVNTNGLTEGGILYVSGVGGYTDIRPTPPNEAYCIGLCLFENPASGVIYINPQNQKLWSELDGRYLQSLTETDPIWSSEKANYETTTQLNTRDTNNRNRANHTGTQTASTISDFDTEVSNNTDVTANTNARHTHANKALLDTYTQTEANLADAVAKKHTHSNLAALENVSGTNTGDQDLSGYLQTSTANSTYLKLDATNSPVTGAITFQRTVSLIGTANEAKQITRLGTSQTANISEVRSADGATLYSGVDNRGIPFSYNGIDADSVYYGRLAGNLTATGTRNIVIGYRAGEAITSGGTNVLIGYLSGYQLTTGSDNFGLGTQALGGLTTGIRNTAIGFQTLLTTNGNNNLALGYRSLALTTGNDNVGVGSTTGGSIDGASNTMVGVQSMLSTTIGNNNVSVGYQAMSTSTGTQSTNVAIGYRAGRGATSTSCVYIGPNAGNITQTVSNLLYIANSTTATPLIYGVFSGATAGLTIHSQNASGIPLTVKGIASQTANLQNWVNSSDTVVSSISATGMLFTSGRRKAVTTKTANYTATANDEVIKFTANATLTLPTATGSGQHYLVRAVGCTVIIDGAGSNTVNEELTQTLNAGDSVQIVDDGVGTWGVY